MDHSAQQAQYNLDSIAESERDQSAFNSLYQPLSPNPAVISANASIQSHPIFGDSIRISHLGTTILVIVKLAKDEEIFDEELITAYDFLAEVLESQEILMNAEKLQALLVDIMIERGLINPTPGKKGEPQTEQLPTYKEFPDWLPQQLNIFNLNEN